MVFVLLLFVKVKKSTVIVNFTEKPIHELTSFKGDCIIN